MSLGATLSGSWQVFFEACAGASGALVGLIFVALSVNIREILKYEHLPARAGAALGAMMLILVTSLTALIPQPPRLLGGEAIVFAAAAWTLQVWSMQRSAAAGKAHQRPRYEDVLVVVFGHAQAAPFVIGGALLLLGRADGVFWLAGGAVAVFILAVIDAWVLLVEILR